MKLAGLLILVLSNQGYWIGGEQGTVTIRAAVEGGLPSADLSWALLLDGVKLGEGKSHLREDGSDLTITITPPAPRTRVALRWVYRLASTTDNKTLETGELPINLFDNHIMDGLAEHLRSKAIVVWDRPAGLAKIFQSAKVPFTAIASASELLALKPDVVLVGPDALDGQMFDQASLQSLASAGASVMIFRQSRSERVLRYPLQDRHPPAAMQWRADHPLLAGFTADDLRAWIEPSRDLTVMQLPADEPALEIGYYPSEVLSRQPGPIDAILVTRTLNHGRIVLCQLHMGDWASDPRSQLFLRNAIDYLLTRPEPTPRPSERTATTPAPHTRPVAATLQY